MRIPNALPCLLGDRGVTLMLAGSRQHAQRPEQLAVRLATRACTRCSRVRPDRLCPSTDTGASGQARQCMAVLHPCPIRMPLRTFRYRPEREPTDFMLRRLSGAGRVGVVMGATRGVVRDCGCRVRGRAHTDRSPGRPVVRSACSSHPNRELCSSRHCDSLITGSGRPGDAHGEVVVVVVVVAAASDGCAASGLTLARAGRGSRISQQSLCLIRALRSASWIRASVTVGVSATHVSATPGPRVRLYHRHQGFGRERLSTPPKPTGEPAKSEGQPRLASMLASDLGAPPSMSSFRRWRPAVVAARRCSSHRRAARGGRRRR
jgi:hypothetical protein